MLVVEVTAKPKINYWSMPLGRF